MSQYGYLVCHECRDILFLGKFVRPADKPNYFHIGGPNESRNSEKPERTRAVWKFLADHVGHTIAVVTSFDDNFEDVAQYRAIGGDTIDDITLEDYLKDFTG